MLTESHLAKDDLGLDHVRGGRSRGLRLGRRLRKRRLLLRLFGRRLRLRGRRFRFGLRGLGVDGLRRYDFILSLFGLSLDDGCGRHDGRRRGGSEDRRGVVGHGSRGLRSQRARLGGLGSVQRGLARGVGVGLAVRELVRQVLGLVSDGGRARCVHELVTFHVEEALCGVSGGAVCVQGRLLALVALALSVQVLEVVQGVLIALHRRFGSEYIRGRAVPAREPGY